MTCTTHHDACECREALFEKIESDRNELAAEVWNMRAAAYGKDRADEYLALYGLKMVDGRIRE